MKKISNWNESVLNSLNAIMEEVSSIIPNILGALAIIIIGWLIIKIVVSILKKALKIAKADKLDDKINEIELFGDKKLNFNIITIITKFVKWFLYLMIIIVVTEILNLTIVSEEIKNFLSYIPQLFSALTIFILGLLFANMAKKGIKSLFDSMDFFGGKLISQLVFVILLVFISVTALNQAGIDTEIITNNITLILASLLLAFSLAMGLGSQKIVAELLKTFYARRTYEIGQTIQFNNITGEVLSINSISITLKTTEGKIVVPIKDIVENQVRIQD
ncbi:mechanosensitive ion channel family protein [Siansivirga zeaxanthinifaciens]|uniref:Membrane protein n=1 Tax=Siansivirga zeaxanthinifaciens CC-SAMT-1 TaxID=1454006 RepID=A0A0C5WME8_9FLAO|nr:mechanosensitive ion channel domain-containing protein [Siansivirga zeaxanthinifaciens]AJR04065.1 membrane protein [Siansivirga zeaxanthinifaciens CC-SAMT-1]